MAPNGQVVARRLDAKRREQTPQALARLVVVTLFVGLWFALWLARIPLPVPFLVTLLAEIAFFIVFWRTVFVLGSTRSIEIAHYCMLAAEIVFHTTIVYFLGGISWLGAFAYVFGLIFTNTFSDLRRGLLYTAGASAAFAALVLLEATGTVPHYDYLAQDPLRYQEPRFVATTLICASGVFFSIYLWVNWVGSQLRHERDTAVRAQDGLLQARGDLQRANIDLERRVRARTADLEAANSALSDSEERFRRLAENAVDIIFRFRVQPDVTFEYVSPAIRDVLGYEPEEFYAEPDLSMRLVHPDDRDSVAQLASTSLDDPTTLRIQHKNGSLVSMEFRTVRIQDASGELLAVEGIARDVTERQRQDEALRESEAKFRAMAETIAAAVFIFQGNHMRYANPAAEAITGYTRDEILKQNFWDVIHPEFRDVVITRGRARQEGAPVPDRYEVKLLRKDGRERWVDFTAGMIEFEGQPAVLGTAFDITERKWAEEALREQARRDPLTGLLNHAAIVDELREVIAAGRDGTTHAVAMVDVDGLKSVNDTYGHQMGDMVLLAVGRALTRHGATVGRYGGDEFVTVLRDTDRGAAEAYRDAVIATLSETSLTDPDTGAAVPLVASIGLAVYPDEARTIEDLIRLSDSAMYSWRRQRMTAPGGRVAAPLARLRAAEMASELIPLLTSSSTLAAKLQLVAHHLSIGAGYDAVQFSLQTSDTDPRPAVTTFGVPREMAEEWNQDIAGRPNVPHPLSLELQRHRRPLIIDDPWNDERLLPAQRVLIQRAGLRSVMVAPMIWEGNNIGVVGVASKREHAFSPPDAQFLSAVATQVTAIARMARLVEDLEAAANRPAA